MKKNIWATNPKNNSTVKSIYDNSVEESHPESWKSMESFFKSQGYINIRKD